MGVEPGLDLGERLRPTVSGRKEDVTSLLGDGDRMPTVAGGTLAREAGRLLERGRVV